MLGYAFVVTAPNPDDATECPVCGFDTLLSFPVHFISDQGVYPGGHCLSCVRCFDMADKETP